MRKEKQINKTHRYNIIKTYTIDEIKAFGTKEFFTDPEFPERTVKLRRARILNQIGHQCVEEGCHLKDFHFGLGIDNGGGIHLDLYGYDEVGELAMITLDHIVPKAKGGPNKKSNYQPMCKVHNEMKAHEYNWARQFKDLSLIYPDDEIVTPNYRIYKEELTERSFGEFKNMGGLFADKYADEFVIGEEYVHLEKKGEGVMMSNHPSETITNQDFINQAHGDVIIFGLGLGMIVFPLLGDKAINSITIVEKDAGLIDAVGSVIKEHDHHNKVKIVEGDAFTYHEDIKKNDFYVDKSNKRRKRQKRFDTIYFDIWIKINEEAFAEMEELHGLYRKFRRKDNASYMTSWCYDLKDEWTEKNLTI